VGHARAPAAAEADPHPQDRVAAVSGGRSPAALALSLQRSAGNRATRRWLLRDVIATPYGGFDVVPEGRPLRIPDVDAPAYEVTSAALEAIRPRLDRIVAGSGRIKFHPEHSTPEFRTTLLRHLAWLCTQPIGLELVGRLDTGAWDVTFQPTSGPSQTFALDPQPEQRFRRPDGAPGRGTNCIVAYDVRRTDIVSAEDMAAIGRPVEAWMTAPPPIHLAHELVHAYEITNGLIPLEPVRSAGPGPTRVTSTTAQGERSAVGLGEFRGEEFTENRFRQAFGMPLRTRYDYRGEDEEHEPAARSLLGR
jgi:hypothetical protein